ncbi:MAG TPA: serine protease [Thermoleophilaceae bacterium]
MGLARRSILLALVLALALPAGASAATRIIGGTDASPGDFPYQVLLDVDGGQCGGSIIDQRHVVTAAHCVEDIDSGFYPRIIDPSTVRVFYGGVDQGANGFNSGGGDLTEVGVDTISVDPRRQRHLGLDEYDSAMLTLDSDIVTGANAQPIGLASPTDLSNAFHPAAGFENPVVSGWGVTTDNPNDDPSRKLKFAHVPLVPDSSSDCSGEYAGDFHPSVMLCAGDSTHDSCYGDSGGPLAIAVNTDTPPANRRLAGLVSFGDGCASARGVYTEVPEPGTTAFIQRRPEISPPSVLGLPHPTGTARVGQKVSCVPPSHPAGVSAERYIWYTLDLNGNFNEFTEGAATVVLPSGALNQRIVCDVRFENAGGYQYIEGDESGALGPVGAAIAPTPTPTPKDTTKPKAKIQKVRCKHGRCSITIKATDSGGNLKTVRERVKGKYKRCRRVHGKRRCKTRSVNKKLKLKKKGGGIYTSKIKLRKGRYAVSVRAVDSVKNSSKLAKKRFRVR